MKVGITLPQFREDAEPALAVARTAEAVGLDGIFVFDHLWPMRQPTRPALYSAVLLGALAVETERVTIGPLVARVSVVANEVLVQAMVSLAAMVGSRLVVGLGSGDSGNRDENEAYGLGFPPVDRRVDDLRICARELRAAGITTWIGGRSGSVMRAAAGADGWNGWGYAKADDFAAAVRDLDHAVVEAGAARRPEPSWGGQVLLGATEREAAEKLARHGDRPGLVHGTPDTLRRHLAALADAGATWAVCAPVDVGTDPESPHLVAEAARI